MERFEIDNTYNGIFDEHDGAIRTLKKKITGMEL